MHTVFVCSYNSREERLSEVSLYCGIYHISTLACSLDGRESHVHVSTMAVRIISDHFEFIENRSRGLDVTWQPLRGDLTMHP